MSNETREHLSCLMDGELSSDAGRFVARRMGNDSELCATWQRYHLIRDCLRRPGETLAITRLTVNLDEVEATPESARRVLPGWLRPVAGGAIAASVAAAAVLVALNLPSQQSGPVAEPFASPNTAGLAPVSQPASYNAASAANQRSINRYLMRHNHVAGAAGQKGFVPYVAIVATAPERVTEQEPAAGEGASAAVDTTVARDSNTENDPGR